MGVVKIDMRRKTRIVYQGKLRLQAPGNRDAVVARVQNLSPLGVFVTTSAADLPEPGSEVSCGFAFNKEARIVRGRVAWVRQASKSSPLSSPGAGIEFLNLAVEDTALLHRLVDPGEQPRQPVEVWFEGMGSPIRCQAVVTGQDVRLATELPFMRIGSLVKVAFTQEGGVMREGALNVARFEPGEDGVPRLQLNVSMSLLDNARGTIEVKSRPTPAGGVAAAANESQPQPPRPTVTIDPAATLAAPPRWLSTMSGATLPPVLTALPRAAPSRGWRPVVIGGLAGIVVVSVILLALSSFLDAPRTPAARPPAGAQLSYPEAPGPPAAPSGPTIEPLAPTAASR